MEHADCVETVLAESMFTMMEADHDCYQEKVPMYESVITSRVPVAAFIVVHPKTLGCVIKQLLNQEED